LPNAKSAGRGWERLTQLGTQNPGKKRWKTSLAQQEDRIGGMEMKLNRKDGCGQMLVLGIDSPTEKKSGSAAL